MTERVISSPVEIALRYITEDLMKMAKIAARDAGITTKEVFDIYLEAMKDTPEYKAIDDCEEEKR